jgi:hypothetical protein
MQAPLERVVKFTGNVNFNGSKNKTPSVWPVVLPTLQGLRRSLD